MPNVVHFGRIHPDPNWGMPLHQHDDVHQTIIVASGVLHVTCGAETYRASAGDIMLYPQHMPHVEQSDRQHPADFFWLSWQGDCSDFPRALHDRAGRIRALVGWIAETSPSERPGCDDYHAATIALLFHEYRRLAATPDGAEPFAAVYAFIEAHYQTPISVADLAAVSALSEAHFIRQFKRHSGQTPMQALRHYRLDQVARLLTTSNQTLDMIATAVGLANAQHLSRCFRERFGCAPGAYRAARRV